MLLDANQGGVALGEGLVSLRERLLRELLLRHLKREGELELWLVSSAASLDLPIPATPRSVKRYGMRSEAERSKAWRS